MNGVIIFEDIMQNDWEVAKSLNFHNRVQCKTAFITKLNRILNIVVVRRARESTGPLGPTKDRANFGRTINMNWEIGTHTCPRATDVNLCHASRHTKNKIKRSHFFINIYSRLGVHYADGHSCSLKSHGPCIHILFSMTRYSVTRLRWAGRRWSLDLCAPEAGTCRGWPCWL